MGQSFEKGRFTPDLTVSPQCRLCFSKKRDFLHVPSGSDMGCEADSGKRMGSVDGPGVNSAEDSSLAVLLEKFTKKILKERANSMQDLHMCRAACVPPLTADSKPPTRAMKKCRPCAEGPAS